MSLEDAINQNTEQLKKNCEIMSKLLALNVSKISEKTIEDDVEEVDTKLSDKMKDKADIVRAKPSRRSRKSSNDAEEVVEDDQEPEVERTTRRSRSTKKEDTDSKKGRRSRTEKKDEKNDEYPNAMVRCRKDKEKSKSGLVFDDIFKQVEEFMSEAQDNDEKQAFHDVIQGFLNDLGYSDILELQPKDYEDFIDKIQEFMEEIFED